MYFIINQRLNCLGTVNACCELLHANNASIRKISDLMTGTGKLVDPNNVNRAMRSNQNRNDRQYSLKTLISIICLLSTVLLSGCTATRPPDFSIGHAQPEAQQDNDIPSVVANAPVVPMPKPVAKLETYTVVVNDVPVRELLFTLARDATINVDIHPGVTGRATLNAVNQTLPQILDRIVKQTALRYQLDGSNLIISPDTPYWRTYRIDYVNLERDSTSESTVATQIATAGGSVAEEGGASGASGNSSKTRVTNKSKGHFWDLVSENVTAIVNKYEEARIKIEIEDKRLKALSNVNAAGNIVENVTNIASGNTQGAVDANNNSASGESEDDISKSVLTNPIGGFLTVYTTEGGHQNVQEYIDLVLVNAQKQVLIEVSIIEVELGDHYQAGVDWAAVSEADMLDDAGKIVGDGLSMLQAVTGANLASAPLFSLGYQKTTSDGGSITAIVKALESFGDVKVISSPKIMALNNQTALLKVVDEKVYFTVELEIQKDEDGRESSRNYLSEIHTVPVGLVMSVMPQINNNDTVTLSIRPTITRITGYAVDPAPKLLDAAFDNLIPEIQVREMDSLLQVPSTNTVVLGGLMQNKVNKNNSGIPFLSQLPLIGNLFSYKNEQFTKTELIIFIKPTVVKNPSLNGDFKEFREYLTFSEDGQNKPVSSLNKAQNTEGASVP